MDWYAWHDHYDDPNSGLAQRLRAVQGQVRAALDTAAPGPLRAISVCAGQGRDLIEPLAVHPRRADVSARLVELDERNTAAARRNAEMAGAGQIEVITADAALIDHYADLAPADIVLLCGIFGNITDEDIERTIDVSRSLVRTGGSVIWTRGRGEHDLFPQICQWFEQRTFDRLWISPPTEIWGVGAHRFTGEPQPLHKGAGMFQFIRH